jgi:hypothetical protein
MRQDYPGGGYVGKKPSKPQFYILTIWLDLFQHIAGISIQSPGLCAGPVA